MNRKYFEILNVNEKHSLGLLVASFFRTSSIFALGVPLAIIANIILARNLSVAEFGTYGLSISVAMVIAIPAISALPLLLTREVAKYSKDKLWECYQGIINISYAWTAGYTAIVFVGFLIYISLSSQQDIPNSTLVFSLLLVPVLSLNAITGGTIRGFGKPALAAAPVQVAQPLLLIVGILVMAKMELLTVKSAIGFYLSATIATFLMLQLLLRFGRPDDFQSAPANYSEHRRWMLSLFPFMAIGAVNTINTQFSILLLGVLENDEAIAYLRVAERGAQLVIFPLMVLDTIFAPKIAVLAKDQNFQALGKLTRASTRLIFILTLLIATILIIFGRPIISMSFGAPYVDATYPALVVLVLAQTLFTAMGPAGMVLAMSGHERQNVIGQILGFVSLLLVGIVLIPTMGSLGAAISASTGLLTMKTYLFVIARRKLSIWTGL